PPAVALIGDAKPTLRRLIDVLPAHSRARPSRQDEMQERQGAPRGPAAHSRARPSRQDEMQERQAKLRARLAKLAPQLAYLEAIRAELPEDGIFVDEVTQVGFVSRLAFPVYQPRTFLSPGYQDNLGWGFATALGAQHARRDVPVLSISGDGGFLFTSHELATAIRHR